MTLPTAPVLDLFTSSDGTVYLVRARCEVCARDVFHGVGHSPEGIPARLGSRVAHCACERYELTDPGGVIPARLAEGVSSSPAAEPPTPPPSAAERIRAALADRDGAWASQLTALARGNPEVYLPALRDMVARGEVESRPSPTGTLYRLPTA